MSKSNPSDWLSQPYHTDFFSIGQTETPPTTAATAESRNGFSLSPDRGRVAKPIRRRSRASRRTPTTLFNTDTANFRAMVQRFTGGPTAAYASGSQLPNGGGLHLMEYISAGGGTVDQPASGFHAQYPSQELRQQQQMMFMMGAGGGVAVPAAAPAPGAVSGTENRSYDNYLPRF